MQLYQIRLQPPLRSKVQGEKGWKEHRAATMRAVGHSFKNRTGDRTGEAVGSGFYWLNRWFTGSMSGFLRYKTNIFIYILH
jgi:hypothetical protein